MASRRMFAKTIIDSDAFMDMPLSTQALYFHLSMRADDEGFINNPKKIMRMIGASEDDFKVLTAKKFIIPFDSGVVVIKHWKIHNYIQKDRCKATVYAEERAMLGVKENGSYTTCIQDGYSLDTDCIQSDNKMDTQVSIGKVSTGEFSVVESSGNGHNDIGTKNILNVDNFVDNFEELPKFECMHGNLGKGVVLLTDEQRSELFDKLGFDAFNHYIEKLATFIIEKGAKVSNHYRTILKWAQEDMGI